MKRILPFIIYAVLLFPGLLLSEEEKSPQQTDNHWNLELNECILLALKSNLGLNISWLDQDIAANNVSAAESDFDPQFNASVRQSESKSSTANSVLTGASQPTNESTNYEIGAQKKFEYGTVVGLSTNLNRATNNSSYTLLDPDYSAGVNATIRQPLWKGFGKEFNLAALMKSQNTYKQSRWNAELAVFELLADVERNYWLLAYAQADLEFKRNSLAVSETTLREAKAKLEADLGSQVDVFAAEADVTSKKEDIIVSENALKGYQDDLLQLMGKIREASDTEPRVNSQVPAYLKKDTPPFDVVFKRANELDPTLKVQQLTIANLEIDRQSAANQNRASIDFIANGGYSGRNDNAPDAYDGVAQRDGYNWSLGLEISFPWKFRNATANELNSLIRLRQAKIRADSIENILMVSLRKAWRSIDANKQRIVTASANLEYSRQALEQERARFREGISTIRDMQEAQRNWDDANQRYLKAMLDTIIAEVDLARLDGSILERHGFTWESIPTPTHTAKEDNVYGSIRN